MKRSTAVRTICWMVSLAATDLLGASLQFDSKVKPNQSYRVEVSRSADFDTIIHSSQIVHSARYQWIGPEMDEIYHWRTIDSQTKIVLGRGTYAVIGPGDGFVSLMWDDQDLSTASFDLTTEVAGQKSSLERVSQNWSSRKRGKEAQLVSVRPAAMKSAFASFVPSLALAKGQAQNLVEVSKLQKIDERKPAKKVVSTPKPREPVIRSTPEPMTPPNPLPVKVADRQQAIRPSAHVSVNSATSAPAVVRSAQAGIPTSRLNLALGGEYSLIQRTKAEVEVESAIASGRMDLEYSGRFAGRGLFKLGLHESKSQARATVDSDFALPEVNLPNSSRRIDLMIGAKLVRSARFNLGLGVSVAHNQYWAIALAYSALDGGDVFERHHFDSAGMNLFGEFFLRPQLSGRLGLEAHSEFESSDARRIGARADLFYRFADTYEVGASGGVDHMISERCHSDLDICSREGSVSANENRSYLQINFGYTWGQSASN